VNTAPVPIQAGPRGGAIRIRNSGGCTTRWDACYSARELSIALRAEGHGGRVNNRLSRRAGVAHQRAHNEEHSIGSARRLNYLTRLSIATRTTWTASSIACCRATCAGDLPPCVAKCRDSANANSVHVGVRVRACAANQASLASNPPELESVSRFRIQCGHDAKLI
jgi:hypothetical protein